MAETTAITTTTQPSSPPQNNPIAFLLSIPQCLFNKVVNFTQNLQQKKAAEGEKQIVTKDESQVTVVKFPVVNKEVSPIKLQGDDVKEDTNPFILWQVYALGGFIVLKWAWGKWQESQASNKDDSPDDDEDEDADAPPSSPPPPPPVV